MKLISGVDLYRLLFFVSGLLIMHFSVHLIDKYALHLRNVNTLVMDEILELDNIYLFSTLRGIETFHPLVSVFEFSKMKLIPEAMAR